MTAVEIQRELSLCTDLCLSVRTIRRRLTEFGHNGRLARKKPFVSRKNRQARMRFAREHLHWTSEDWSKVLFSDESKFNRLGSDGPRYVRRRPSEEFDPKCIRGTVKGGGGSVMVWGAMRRDGIDPVHRIEGIMDKNVYVDILKSVMQPYARNFMGQDYIFQHDNDPKHTSALVRTWLSSENVEVLEWPAQSPDLNPIENLWIDVNEAIKRGKPKNIKELYETIENAWYDIPIERCQKLVDSMPRRCAAVIKSEGYPIKY
ncbi:hypothetical protein Y032_0001g414 [Ancylostoma ceylanicum]|nr:hypothetical protein Y032_0001g414 [Ancylostoma ceylanicum]